MNQQEVFDRVKAHLLAQGERCSQKVLGDFVCRYRHDGKMCAIGPLIADEHYSEQLEGQGATCEPILKALAASGIHVETASDRDLLHELQTIHDEYEPEYWATELADTARGFGLCNN